MQTATSDGILTNYLFPCTSRFERKPQLEADQRLLARSAVRPKTSRGLFDGALPNL